MEIQRRIKIFAPYPIPLPQNLANNHRYPIFEQFRVSGLKKKAIVNTIHVYFDITHFPCNYITFTGVQYQLVTQHLLIIS